MYANFASWTYGMEPLLWYFIRQIHSATHIAKQKSKRYWQISQFDKKEEVLWYNWRANFSAWRAF